MLQHLMDSGQQVSADREEAHGHPSRDAAGAKYGAEGSDGLGASSHRGWAGDGRGTQGRGTQGRGTQDGDATLRALAALSDALAEMSHDQRLLERRLRELHRQRAEGRAWHDILDEEDVPGTMQVVSRMLACLARASGTLRKELVDALRREGVSIPGIAKLFGVTHQRVSNLLRRSDG